MTARLPVIPTIIVLAAVATMIALGIWQLGRADEKEALIARYGQAQAISTEVPFPHLLAEVEGALYRRSTLTCDRVLDRRTTAARNAEGHSGLAQVVNCAVDGGGEAEIALGWTSTTDVVAWNGGTVSGFVVPAGDAARLVASPAVSGLEPLARPDPGDLPNNHIAYAGQWFFFALTALVIYWLALRRRGRNG